MNYMIVNIDPGSWMGLFLGFWSAS